jgi:TonB dependent receptor/Carboxypeptidase regulatory-like domain/TonB-dependent Receptor Plug Domain
MTACVRFIVIGLAAALVFSPAGAGAQPGATGAIEGTVRTTTGAPIAGANIALQGAVSKGTTTSAQGAYRFTSLPPGLYEVTATKVGFVQAGTVVTVALSSTVTADIALAPRSFQSLRAIAHVSTNAPGHAQINQSTAAVSVIPHSDFQEQAQTQVMNVLNQTPGIIAWGQPEANNGASQFTPQVVQIRGALPYETETLIDGHATPLSLTGYFDPSLLNPAMLQNVEIVKGPGSMPVEINNAIGGTVNFVTLQPTRTPQATLIQQVDNFGGVATAVRFTGSLPSNFLQYAFAYSTDGAPGPMQGYPGAGSAFFLTLGSDWKVDGRSLAAAAPYNFALAPAESYNRYYGLFGQLRVAEPFYVCCYPFYTAFTGTNQLGKLRFNFSQNTSLTVSFLGGQDFGPQGNYGVAAAVSPVGGLLGASFSSFAPPAGYTGSVASGTQMPFDLSAYAPTFGSIQQYLYQAEFRTTFGPWTALARYYDGGNVDYSYLQSAPDGFFGYSGSTWGGAPLCPPGTTFNGKACSPGNLKPTMTYFNGQSVAFSAQDAVYQQLIDNHELGESLEFDRGFANGSDLTLALDRHSQSGFEFINEPTSGLPPYDALPPGASQLFDTESARFDFFVAPRIEANLAYYAIQYQSHFTDNGGGILPGSGPASWTDATHGFNAPRAGFTWQPNRDTSWRLALGSSIAPPYLTLLSSPGTAPSENITAYPAGGYTEDLNNGNIAPETAFSYDVGVDKRIHQSMYVSFDAYLTNLHDMYLPSTFLINQDYNPPGCPKVGTCPLYGAETENLGHARYEGLELAFGNAPLAGLGFRVQGDLMRAYAYDLPQGFYCTNVPAGECTPFHYDTNLGIIPGINFQQSGIGYNSINGAAVPYSMGYAELNYRIPAGAFFRIGATYYGPNNAYSQPAFVIFSTGLRLPIGPNIAIQLSGNNLTNQYGQLWASQYGGVPSVLVPQCVGKYNGPAYLTTGAACAALVEAGKVPRSAVAVVPQLGITSGGNYGPATFALQLIEQIGKP